MLKTINKPHPVVEVIFQMVMMLKPIDGIGENDGWNGAKQMMANPSKFVNELQKFSSKIGSVNSKMIDKIRHIDSKEQE